MSWRISSRLTTDDIDATTSPLLFDVRRCTVAVDDDVANAATSGKMEMPRSFLLSDEDAEKFKILFVGGVLSL